MFFCFMQSKCSHKIHDIMTIITLPIPVFCFIIIVVVDIIIIIIIIYYTAAAAALTHSKS